MPKLIILRGENVERELDLGTVDLRIGRGAENDLILEDPTKAVSRFHAEIRPEGGGWVLIDLNSQNGTWIDGRRVQKAALTPGVTVSLGPYHLKYQDTAPAAASASAAAAPPSTTDTLVGGKLRAPAPPPIAAKPAAAPARPPVKAAPKGKAPRPAADDNLVSRLVRNKPLLFGGFGAFMVLIVILGRIVNSPEAPAAGSGSTAPASQSAAPAASQPTNDEIIARHLADGKALLERGDAATALRDHFEQVLLIDPSQPEATELKLKAEEMIRQAQASAPPAEPTPSPAAAASSAPPSSTPAAGAGATPARQVDPSGVARNPGESQADWRARSGRIRTRYNDAKAALQRNDFDAAVAGFEALERDQPDYQDVHALLATARSGRSAGAQAAMASAASLEKSGDYAGALAQLTRAKQLDASIDVDADASRIRGLIQKDAEDAYSRARVYDARGRVPEAVALYERVVQLLAADHPNRKAAEERLAVLRSKP